MAMSRRRLLQKARATSKSPRSCWPPCRSFRITGSFNLTCRTSLHPTICFAIGWKVGCNARSTRYKPWTYQATQLLKTKNTKPTQIKLHNKTK